MKKILVCLCLFLLSFPLTSAVEFLGFHADIQDMQVLLSWSTATETANLGFILERKTDPLSAWTPLVSYINNDALAGQGTVSYPTEYSYLDSTVIEGVTYLYRISGVDEANNIGVLDSLSITVSEVSTADVIPVHMDLTAYPNPFNPRITITYRLPESGMIRMTVYDVRGIPVKKLFAGFSLSGEHQLIWSAENMPGGIYILKIAAENIARTQKLLLLK